MIAEGIFSYRIGGSERVGADLAIEFRRRGYAVVCFAFRDSDGPLRRELERSGVRCLDMNYEKCTGPLRRVRYMWKFWRMLRRERVDALHVHHAGALLVAGIPGRVARIGRVVMTEHALHQFKASWRYRRAAAYYCRYASDITVVEPTQIDYFHDVLRVPRGRLHYVANGVRLLARTPERVRRMRAQLGVPDDVFAFLYVGRLEAVKDLGTLLQAFAQLPPDVRARARLYLAGDGTERVALERLRDSLGLEPAVFLLGARHDVADLLMAADAFVMSSKTEGLPLALLEAMAAGVPCVATAVGGIPDLFGADRGIAVPPQDPARLAAAMTSLARSPELRARLVDRASQNLRRHYSLDAIADRYLQLLGLPLRAKATIEAA